MKITTCTILNPYPTRFINVSFDLRKTERCKLIKSDDTLLSPPLFHGHRSIILKLNQFEHFLLPFEMVYFNGLLTTEGIIHEL